MAAYADDFDDASNEETPGPLLPPEDRLWRHPSELAEKPHSLALDPLAVRSRWIQSEPSRASAWTAGLVGALLATGLVALGIHLVGKIPSSSGSDNRLVSVSTTIATHHPPSVPTADGVGQSLSAAIRHVGAAIVMIESANGSSDTRFLGVAIGKNGVLLAPAVDLTNSTSILVTVPRSSVPDVGHLVGLDAASGLAVLKIDGVNNLSTVSLSGGALEASDLALAVTSPMGARYTIGAVQASDVTATNGATHLVDAVATDIDSSSAPLGSPLLNANGAVTGIVVATDRTGALVTPAWMADPIVQQLLLTGSVNHGWLGIKGTTMHEPGIPEGVEVNSVLPKSAGAEAGLRPGDVITSLDDERVTSMPALQGRLYVLKAGERVTLSLSRSGKAMNVGLLLDDAA